MKSKKTAALTTMTAAMLAVGLTASPTGATFTDAVTTQASVTTGTLDVAMSGQDSVPLLFGKELAFAFEQNRPREQKLTLSNTGSVDVAVTVSATATGPGEAIAAHLQARVTAGGSLLFEGALSEVETPSRALVIAAGDEANVTVQVTASDSAPASVRGVPTHVGLNLVSRQASLSVAGEPAPTQGWSDTETRSVPACITDLRAPFADSNFDWISQPSWSVSENTGLASYYDGAYRTVATATPIGSHALETTATVRPESVPGASVGRGVIVWPRTLEEFGSWLPSARKIDAAGQKWTASVLLKGQRGKYLSVGVRAITPAGHVGENFGVPQQLTGDWQTLTFTVAAPASWVGGALGVQVASSMPDVDNPFQIAGVQVERGACTSTYSKVTF